jgi:glycosyltransferase involved in cell wall biosynthesis
LLGDGYIENLYSDGGLPFSIILSGYLKRIFWLLRACSFDLIWIEKELFPWLPSWAEDILVCFHIPIVVDYDDAISHPYAFHKNRIVKAILGNKIDKIMREAALVIVGNDYLGQQAQRAGAKRVEYIPSVVDQHKWFPKTPSKIGFRIGWIGSPVTAPYLSIIKEPLMKLCDDPGTTLVIIGAGSHDYLPGVRKVELPWTEETEARNVNSFDVGIMPLPNGHFEEGKCGYKLIQYMASGLPVVASPVGVNKQIVDEDVTGYLASNAEEWYSVLFDLRNNIEKRAKMGEAGRKKFEEKYSLDITAPRLLNLLISVVNKRK